MARPLRLEYPGALRHITSRGNERKAIFRDDRDRRLLLSILAEVVQRFRWRLHSYALMPNHHHLLVETPEPTMARGMKHLNGVYAQKFNRRHGRCGHLFQGRYDARLIEDMPYLLVASRYVVLNPVRALIVMLPEEYEWSSYRATAGLVPPPDWLQVDWTLSLFGSDVERARAGYRQFVLDGIERTESDRRILVGDPVVGTPPFLNEIQGRIDRQARSREHPWVERNVARLSVDRVVESACRVFNVGPDDLKAASSDEARSALALICYLDCRSSLNEIGLFVGLRTSGVHYLLKRGRARLKQSEPFRRRVELIRHLSRPIED